VNRFDSPRPDLLQDTRNIFAFAALLSAGFASVGLIGEGLKVVPYSLLPAAACGIASLILACFGLWLAPRVPNLTALSAVILSGLVFAATLAIHFAGGPQSFLTALYIGITVGAAFLMGQRGALGIAALSAACFSTLVGLEYSGALPINPLWGPIPSPSDFGPVFAGLIFSVLVPTFVVAYVAGTLADRLTRRTTEQATLSQLARDTASSLDPEEVMRTVLRSAIDNTHSDRGGIYLYDAARQRMINAAAIRLGQPLEAAEADASWSVLRGVVGRVMRHGESARVADVSRDPDYVNEATDTRSELCVPIIRDQHVEGVINLESTRLNAYTDADQRFVEQLAQHAAIALSNARLYEATEQNLHNVARANLEIRALQESLSAVQSALELDKVLQHVCDAVVMLGYDLATLATADPHGRQLAVRAVAAADARLVGRLEELLGLRLIGLRTSTRRKQNIGARALVERRVLVSNRGADFLYPIGARGSRSEVLEGVGLRVGAAIPLLIRDEALGILYAFGHKPELSQVELSSLQAFGAQAAVALDKASLFEEARTVRDRLQAVMDATHDGLILFDAQARLVLANRAAETLLGVPFTTHLGKPLPAILEQSGLATRLFPSEDPAELQARIDREVEAIVTGRREESDDVARRQITIPGSKTRFLEEFDLNVQDGQGRYMGRLIVLHNVTAQKQLESDREAFTQMLVHDLRSPLSAIIGGLQLIELGIQENDSPDLVLKSARVALASANKLLGLISSLLDVQKLERGQLDLQLQPLAPASLVHDALDILRPLAEMSDISLVAHADYDLPAVLGDAEHMRRVLINLMDNALKFVGAGGQVTASATLDGNFVRIAVSDNGPGIPPEYRERIFERFVQVPGRVSRRRGTGLGLTYCRMVVEMHGGKIWVESPPGGGSHFVFTLPIAGS
jgi:signal transduction histidine kinase/putative methionine-R-sulfoxide reductase with GAF domain